MAASENPLPANASYAELLQLALVACEIARDSAAATADTLAGQSPGAIAQITDGERKLDLIDAELDERLAPAVTQANTAVVRELLVCMKFVLDLERIGDLLCSVPPRVQALDPTFDMADLKDLIEMATILEAMLRDAHIGLATRNVDLALGIVRADAEIDRRRNLLYFRLMEGTSNATRNSIHALFIANALERAGDHAVNLGEEICHLVTGHSIRHVRRQNDRSHEQHYLDQLRRKDFAASAAALI